MAKYKNRYTALECDNTGYRLSCSIYVCVRACVRGVKEVSKAILVEKFKPSDISLQFSLYYTASKVRINRPYGQMGIRYEGLIQKIPIFQFFGII